MAFALSVSYVLERNIFRLLTRTSSDKFRKRCLFVKLTVSSTSNVNESNNESSGSLSVVQMSTFRPLVFCGPSGSGKSTLLKRLINEHEKWFQVSVSHTTRKPRPGETNGKEYHFVTSEEMDKAIARGEFIEHTKFSGNMYGTSKRAVEDVIKEGRICVLDIEIEGVKSIKNTNFNPRCVFIKPPSLQILEERLRNRGTETEETLKKRLSRAALELQYGEEPGNFDLVIVNDNFEEAYEKLENFLIKEIEELSGKKPEF
ncbi:guanylate kinase-like isoform X2 [Varroa jacobsoni]|uniref:guanylate kinase n=1 Tax=Varroa destructor TaxID=109461 RepID=A0A7M7KVL2_VARDE|nr:guanylate kinase-like isoform X3 [Varroa destructor]XP_022710225.1 guanylate kinase-like isoform X2 [Varroa jacobsoni]